tara:strand:+ start:53 stop:514 length:462 start_codon:yes stop_codon:yes gene_type:complete
MINKTEIEKAQESWGNGIITIGKLKDNPKESRIFTVNFINKHYDFAFGDVLFKPTKVSEKQFRNNNKSALSYFIGSDNDFAEDKGFALNPWVKVDFKNEAINIYDNLATAMGNYFFTDPRGEKTKVEFSFVYKKNKEGEIKIVLHHSSFPFCG